MKIRITCYPDEAHAIIERLKEIFVVENVSMGYANKSGKVRIYIDAH